MNRFRFFTNQIKIDDYKILSVSVAFFLAILRLPHLQVSYSHDSSSQVLIESLFAHGYYSGLDFIQNIGYLGFLSYPDVFYPPLFWTKLGYIIVSTLMLTVVFVNIAFDLLRGPLKIIFLLWLAVMLNWDSILYVFYFSAGFYAMNVYKKGGALSIWIVLPTLILTVLFAFAKGTGLYIGSGLLLIISMGFCNSKYAYYLFAALSAVLIATIIRSGVSLIEIKNYLMANALFNQMYIANLGSEPSIRNYVIPLLMLCLMLAQVGLQVFKRISMRGVVCAVYLIGVLVVCFLHSTIRADEHIVALLNLSVGGSLMFAGTCSSYDKFDS